MRKLALSAAVLSLFGLAACTGLSNTVNTTPASTSGATAATTGAHAAAAAQKAATVGNSITISGDTGEKITITLVKVDPDARGSDEFNTPDAGKQFYAAQLRITNVGTVTYSDDADNCTTLKDASGQQFQPDFSTITDGQSLDSMNIAVGDSVLGYLVYQVPTGDKAGELQYTIDAGMGTGTAQWKLS